MYCQTSWLPSVNTKKSTKECAFLSGSGSEETGLQGAHSFASQHPAARRIAVAVNLEAAGTGGKGVVFQVGSCCEASGYY